MYMYMYYIIHNTYTHQASGDNNDIIYQTTPHPTPLIGLHFLDIKVHNTTLRRA